MTFTMTRLFKPPHPRLTLRDDALPALGLTVRQTAQQRDVSRVLNGRAAISPEMALRIEAWLGVACGGETLLWLAEQSAYDVWQAQLRFKAKPMHVQHAPMAAQISFAPAWPATISGALEIYTAKADQKGLRTAP